jgi:serine/threonine-protein kinase
LIGTILRVRYELLQQLDEDPVFITYRARDRVAGRDVSVRTLQQPFCQEPEFIEKLRAVCLKLSAVQDEHVERIRELDDDETMVFVVSDLGPEQSLAERLRKLLSLSAPIAVTTAIGVLRGLEKLHAAGIVHGDVSARNVMLSATGQIQVRNGGIWESYSASRTAGAVMLPYLAPYLAPEIAAGGMPTPTSDVYAVGVLLYVMLTGREPFAGDTPVAVAVKHATAPPPSLRALSPASPAILEQIVLKALSKQPQDRYQTAAEMLGDLRMLQDAMRFGRQLTWPIQRRPGEGPAAQPITPPLSAIRTDRPSRPAKLPPPTDDFASDGDLPRWLSWLAYAGAGVLLVLIGSWLFFNLNKPKLLEVPRIIGRSANEASAILSDMGLRMRISRREPSDKYPEEAVIDVNPSPGSSVREHGTVSVVLSSGSRFVEVPDLRGRDVEDARSLLSLKGLVLDDAIRYARDRNVPAGKIIAQVPEPRRKVERQTVIRVVVSGTNPSADSGTNVDNVRNTYRLSITMPKGDVSVLVRVDMTDARGTATVYEARHAPGDVFEVEAEGYGDSATFRIFFDGEIVKQVTKDASEAVGAGGNER